MATDTKKKASDKFAESKMTMAGRSLKEGVKSALKSVSRGGAADKASSAAKEKSAKTRKAIDKE
jgi:hypothetical protein